MGINWQFLCDFSGETQFNKNELVHGSSNGSINDTGINQVNTISAQNTISIVDASGDYLYM